MPSTFLRIWKEIPGVGGERLALLEWESEPAKFRNLVRLNADGSVVWTVEPPHPLEGVYTDVSFDGTVVSAYNYVGYLDVIDYSTGKVINREFAK